MIFNGPIGEFLIAIFLLLAGAALIGCGVNVCWLRFNRKKGTAILEGVKKVTCYCHIPPATLIEIVSAKYMNHIPTIDLIKKYPSERDRQYVHTIALLDVLEAEVREMLKDDAEFLAHFLDCRRHALQVMKEKMSDLGTHLRPGKLFEIQPKGYSAHRLYQTKVR